MKKNAFLLIFITICGRVYGTLYPDEIDEAFVKDAGDGKVHELKELKKEAEKYNSELEKKREEAFKGGDGFLVCFYANLNYFKHPLANETIETALKKAVEKKQSEAVKYLCALLLEKDEKLNKQ
jgi:hypothetical protein